MSWLDDTVKAASEFGRMIDETIEDAKVREWLKNGEIDKYFAYMAEKAKGHGKKGIEAFENMLKTLKEQPLAETAGDVAKNVRDAAASLYEGAAEYVENPNKIIEDLQKNKTSLWTYGLAGGAGLVVAFFVSSILSIFGDTDEKGEEASGWGTTILSLVAGAAAMFMLLPAIRGEVKNSKVINASAGDTPASPEADDVSAPYQVETPKPLQAVLKGSDIVVKPTLISRDADTPEAQTVPHAVSNGRGAPAVQG